jgi:surface antigen
MYKKPLFIVAFFGVVLLFGGTASANENLASDTSDLIENKSELAFVKQDKIAYSEQTPEELIKDKKEDNEKTQSEKEGDKRTHKVAEGDTLSKIADEFELEWTDLWNKNLQLDNPDVISVGDKIEIPDPDEELETRPLPEPPVVQRAEPQQAIAPSYPASSSHTPVTSNNASATTATQQSQATTQPAVQTSYRGSSAGNTYAPGYCTWYAKNMRPDLPNNLGNADTWVARAAAQGIPTGAAPRVGAIGQQGMHVVYVQAVNGNGTVTISEMNYSGLYQINTRTVAASSFYYIY